VSLDYITPPPDLVPGSIVWAYLRDSGGDSQEQSVGQQRAEVSDYCHRHGLALGHVLADVAKSGGSVVGRDAFNDLIEMTSDPNLRPAGVLLWNFARFARNLDDSGYYKALLRKRGIVVHSLTDPIPDGPYGRAVETLIDISNEEKRRQTGRDVKRALAALTRQGFAPGGTPPRGYIAEHVVIGTKRDGQPRRVSRWVPDPKLWEFVQMAWRMRAEGKTYGEIAKATSGMLYTSKNCWATFFRNKSYLGIGKCGALEVPDHHLAAIDQATWDAVQKVRQSARSNTQRGNPNHPRRVGSPSLLSGLAVCVHCGSPMMYGKTNTTRRNPWPYYLCGQKSRKGWKSCKGRTVNGRKADAEVLNAVLDKVLTPDLMEPLRLHLQHRANNRSALQHDVQLAQEALAECEKTIHHLVDQIEHFGPSTFIAKKLQEREGERARLMENLKAAKAASQVSQLQVTPELLAATLDDVRSEVLGARDAHELALLRRMLRHYVEKIELGYNVARIHYKLSWDALDQGLGSVPVGALIQSEVKALVHTWE